MGSATVEEYVELLNAEQHVDLQKLRDLARHGVQPQVRGEVWLYLLGVLSDDKGQEMTSVRSKYLEYEALDKHNPALEKRVRSECSRYYQKRLGARPPPGRTLMRSSKSVPSRRPGGFAHAPVTTGGCGLGGAGTREYATDGAQASHSGSTSGAANSSGSLATANGSSFAATTTEAMLGSDRGPNRVNDGRIHALGGIIGESGVSAAMDADDPEAAAALELKRFGRSVENTICAFMNRCAAADLAHRRAIQEGNGGSPGWAAAAPASSATTSNGSTVGYNSAARLADGVRGRLWSGSEHIDSSSADDTFGPNGGQDGNAANGLAHSRDVSTSQPPRGGGASGNAPRHGSNHGYGATSVARSRSRTGSLSGINGGGGAATPSSGGTYASCLEDAVRSRMPREYEWQPQISRPSIGSSGSAAEFHPALVYLCAPFVQCVRVEAGMYFAFEKLMMLMARHSARNPLPRQVATFLTLFRTTLPELYSYFEEEEVDILGFATNWLQHLLAGELRIEDLMRLWDTYFAMPDFLDLHLYVCIAILTNCKDSLEELDRSETRSMLDSLPPLDIDRVSVFQQQASSQRHTSHLFLFVLVSFTRIHSASQPRALPYLHVYRSSTKLSISGSATNAPRGPTTYDLHFRILLQLLQHITPSHRSKQADCGAY